MIIVNGKVNRNHPLTCFAQVLILQWQCPKPNCFVQYQLFFVQLAVTGIYQLVADELAISEKAHDFHKQRSIANG